MKYSTEHKLIEKITATEPQPHRTAFKYFAIFKNDAHSFEPGETPSNSACNQAPKLCSTFLNIAKHDEIMTKIQFHRNRKFRRFNNDLITVIGVLYSFVNICAKSVKIGKCVYDRSTSYVFRKKNDNSYRKAPDIFQQYPTVSDLYRLGMMFTEKNH